MTNGTIEIVCPHCAASTTRQPSGGKPAAAAALIEAAQAFFPS